MTDPYQDVPLPFSDGDTSKQAAEQMREPARSIRAKVLLYIESCGDMGSTCDEAEQVLGLTHQTCSARFHELKSNRFNLIRDSGKRRKTRGGRNAVVYVTVPPSQ
jgi:hypothetical protein